MTDSSPDRLGPQKFEELDVAESHSMCRRCTKPATHRIHLVVRAQRPKGSGRSGMAPQVASHKSDLCEACAVQLFSKFREVAR